MNTAEDGFAVRLVQMCSCCCSSTSSGRSRVDRVVFIRMCRQRRPAGIHRIVHVTPSKTYRKHTVRVAAFACEARKGCCCIPTRIRRSSSSLGVLFEAGCGSDQVLNLRGSLWCDFSGRTLDHEGDVTANTRRKIDSGDRCM
jgi:hypothetical protein